MSSSERNFAIVRRQAGVFRELPGTDPRYIIQAAAWNKNVDIYFSLRGKRAICIYIATVYTQGGHYVHPDDDSVISLAGVFLYHLNAKSPLLVDDDTFTVRTIVSEHPRGSWTGEYVDFDIRSQAVKLNSTWVDSAIQSWLNFKNAPGQNLYSALFQLSYFRLCHAFLHETGHLLQTFLGRGSLDTPPYTSGGRQSRHPGPAGEAGEFMEKIIIGGLVDFYQDGSALGQYTGYPWIAGETESFRFTRRADLHSIGILLQPDWRGSDEYIVSGTGQAAELTGQVRRPVNLTGTIMSTVRSSHSPRVAGAEIPASPRGNVIRVMDFERAISAPPPVTLDSAA